MKGNAVTKKIVLLMVALTIVFSVALVEASTGSKQIEVDYRDISILVNGEEIPSDVEPFVFEGRTFVPIRFIAEALRQNVSWDQEKYQVRVAQPLVLDENFNEKTLFLSSDFQLFTVALQGNPTTGYSWTVKDFDQSLIKSVGEPVYQSETSTIPLVGQGGTFFFSFLTQGKEGEITLDFAYSRSWESNPPEREFTLKVQIIDPQIAISLKEEDSGSAVYLGLNSSLKISLPGNPSTGYSWEIVSADASILSLKGEPNFIPESKALGAPGTYVFQFSPQSPGQT